METTRRQNLTNRLNAALGCISGQMLRSLLDECETLGIEASQAKIIQLLDQQGATPLSDISHTLGYSKEETTKTVDQLIHKKLVACPSNEIYELDMAGRATAARMRTSQLELEDRPPR